METTHTDLVDYAWKYLINTLRCSFAFKELITGNTSGEVPDAIGWTLGESVLIECKRTRSDFFADQRKSFRRDPEEGMGRFRFYLCPKGVLRPDDMPPGWGLLVLDGRKVRRIHGPTGQMNRWYDQWVWNHLANKHAERSMMISALRRCHLRGHLKEIQSL